MIDYSKMYRDRPIMVAAKLHKEHDSDAIKVAIKRRRAWLMDDDEWEHWSSVLKMLDKWNDARCEESTVVNCVAV